MTRQEDLLEFCIILCLSEATVLSNRSTGGFHVRTSTSEHLISLKGKKKEKKRHFHSTVVAFLTGTNIVTLLAVDFESALTFNRRDESRGKLKVNTQTKTQRLKNYRHFKFILHVVSESPP